jgi:hypothetical protein
LGSDVSKEKLQTSCRKIAKEVVGGEGKEKGAGTVTITAVLVERYFGQRRWILNEVSGNKALAAQILGIDGASQSRKLKKSGLMKRSQPLYNC